VSRINVYHEDEETGEQVLAGWFSNDAARYFGEDTWWDGRNNISVNTGSQWNHEGLYLTSSGRWVLNQWSQWQGSRETYRYVPEDWAREWLIRNNHDEDVTELFGSLEPEWERPVG